jgi:hypothetical protein
MLNLMEIRLAVPYGQTERLTDTQTGVMTLKIAFRNFADEPKKDQTSLSSLNYVWLSLHLFSRNSRSLSALTGDLRQF